jgi:hypothetical protein
MRRSDVIMAVRRVLLSDWDPIGVCDEPQAQDEYDDYVPDIVRLLREGAGANTLANHLLRIEAEEMCLPSNPERARHAAMKLKQLSA